MIFNLIKTAKQLFINKSNTGVEADNVEDAIKVLNSNIEYKGVYKGNLDELREKNNCGGYFIELSNSVSGTQPFNNGYYFLSLPIEYKGKLQRATHFSTGEVKERTYMNNTWYPWTPTKQNAIHSNIAFASNGMAVNTNDGGYTIKNDNKKWRIHANGGFLWIHEFDLDSNVISYFVFNDGDFKANNGDIIDGDGNKLSDIASKIATELTDIKTVSGNLQIYNSNSKATHSYYNTVNADARYQLPVGTVIMNESATSSGMSYGTWKYLGVTAFTVNGGALQYKLWLRTA